MHHYCSKIRKSVTKTEVVFSDWQTIQESDICRFPGCTEWGKLNNWTFDILICLQLNLNSAFTKAELHLWSHNKLLCFRTLQTMQGWQGGSFWRVCVSASRTVWACVRVWQQNKTSWQFCGLKSMYCFFSCQNLTGHSTLRTEQNELE